MQKTTNISQLFINILTITIYIIALTIQLKLNAYSKFISSRSLFRYRRMRQVKRSDIALKYSYLLSTYTLRQRVLLKQIWIINNKLFIFSFISLFYSLSIFISLLLQVVSYISYPQRRLILKVILFPNLLYQIPLPPFRSSLSILQRQVKTGGECNNPK